MTTTPVGDASIPTASGATASDTSNDTASTIHTEHGDTSGGEMSPGSQSVASVTEAVPSASKGSSFLQVLFTSLVTVDKCWKNDLIDGICVSNTISVTPLSLSLYLFPSVFSSTPLSPSLILTLSISPFFCLYLSLSLSFSFSLSLPLYLCLFLFHLSLSPPPSLPPVNVICTCSLPTNKCRPINPAFLDCDRTMVQLD